MKKLGGNAALKGRHLGMVHQHMQTQENGFQSQADWLLLHGCMMPLSEFLRSRTFFKHLGLSLGSVAVLVAAVLFWLSLYTRHGKTIEVPNLKGQSVATAKASLEARHLRLFIIDSLYQPLVAPGAILDQNPSPGVRVKENRTVYISVNATRPPQVSLPALQNASLRQAKAVLQSLGLRLGEITYAPDIAKDAVLKLLVAGREAKAGSPVPLNTAVDLVLGDGLQGERIDLPYCIDLTPVDARTLIGEAGLSVGAEIFDASVTDSAQARVYQQSPVFSPGAQVRTGTPIDLFYTQEYSRIPARRDTLNPHP